MSGVIKISRVYSPDSPAEGMPYKSGMMNGKRKHYGEVKLAESLLHLITLSLSQRKRSSHTDKIYVAYVGVAPGKYLGEILALFPNLTVEGWDPNEVNTVFKAPGDAARLHTHTKLFEKTDAVELARRVAAKREEKCLTLFVSDIRGKLVTDTRQRRAATEEQIMEDMRLQAEWARTVKADYTQLKFRPPYSFIRGTSFRMDRYEYIGGSASTVFFQAYPPLRSTETRLVVPRHDLRSTTVYDTKRYEELLNEHNLKTREMTVTSTLDLQTTFLLDRHDSYASIDKAWLGETVASYTRTVCGLPRTPATFKREREIINALVSACFR